LLGYQVGITEALDLFDAHVLCDAEAMHKHLTLGYVVGGVEVYLQYKL
jgi:hypothetical protein